MKGLPNAYIISAARTPVGAFGKGLARLRVAELGAAALRGAMAQGQVSPDHVQEAFLGNVLSAGVGQSPARQAVLAAGCLNSTEATTINKVCASGLKAVILAAQAVQTGSRSLMLAGGMESMSNVPFYFPRNAAFGHQTARDGILQDGLWDAYHDVHMGQCAEETASEYGISRQEQDAHAIASYQRAAKAWADAAFTKEIVPIPMKDRKGATVLFDQDEEYTNVRFDKIPTLKGAFVKNGTVTAANSSTLSDGASALVIVSEEAIAAQRCGPPLARILAHADVACAPKHFTIAPTHAVQEALRRAHLTVGEVARFEINEAFSVVALVNERLLQLDPARVNVLGGAVALGHPIGSSGARILVSLVHQLAKPGDIGVAAICNGGGAASAVVVQRM